MSTAMIKSVPSPGSPSQTPARVSSGAVFRSLPRSLILACSCANRSSFSLSLSLLAAVLNCASGMANSGMSACFCVAAVASGASFAASFPAASAVLASATFSSAAELSVVSSASGAFCAASAAAMISSSFFDFRPLCLGIVAKISSRFSAFVFSSTVFASISVSLKSDFCSILVVFFFVSRFSPAFPFTL